MTTNANQATEVARIRAVIEDWSEGLRRKDAGRVVGHHGTGFVMYSLAPPLVSDAAGTAGLNAWFATWRGGLEIEHRDLQVVVGGDVAFAHCLTRLAGTKTDGQRNEVWFRHSFGLRKEGEAWRIVHVHESVPFRMDGSYLAEVDLVP